MKNWLKSQCGVIVNIIKQIVRNLPIYFSILFEIIMYWLIGLYRVPTHWNNNQDKILARFRTFIFLNSFLGRPLRKWEGIFWKSYSFRLIQTFIQDSTLISVTTELIYDFLILKRFIANVWMLQSPKNHRMFQIIWGLRRGRLRRGCLGF